MELTAHKVLTNYQKIGHGPVLVLLHGWGCDWQIFSPVIAGLSEQYQLIIPDLPAFGQSHSPTEVWDSAEYVVWLKDFLAQTVDTKPFSLLGHSFGGKLAAMLAASHFPAGLTQIILCSASGLPAPLSPTQQLQQRLLTLIPRVLKAQLSTQFRERLLKMTHSSTDYMYANDMQKKILQRVIHENISQELEKIVTPTLLIWGDVDADTPLVQAKRFSTLIKGSELVVFNGVGHFPFIEQPTRFNSVLRAL